jgi:hypothetical protein
VSASKVFNLVRCAAETCSALGAEDEAVVLVLGYINTNANHNNTSSGEFVMLRPQDTLLL